MSRKTPHILKCQHKQCRMGAQFVPSSRKCTLTLSSETASAYQLKWAPALSSQANHQARHRDRLEHNVLAKSIGEPHLADQNKHWKISEKSQHWAHLSARLMIRISV